MNYPSSWSIFKHTALYECGVVDLEDKMNKRCTMFLIFSVIVSLVLAGCNLPSTQPTPVPETPTLPPQLINPQPESTATLVPTVIPVEPSPTAAKEIVHKDIPGAPVGKIMQTVYDQVDETSALKKQAFGGDNFRVGKYERPFDQNMNYLPQADLVSIQLSREDPLWIYILFKVNKSLSADPSGKTHFMIELDTDLDSRGEFIVITGIPKSTTWSTESVLVLSNPDKNVGGITVVKPDKNLSEGRGYYNEIFNAGVGDDADLAWSRISKVDPTVVQLAFKNTLTGGEKGKFIWLPWTDAGMLDWSLFEFNDHFTYEQAGYPLKEDPQNYPIKALWGVDNTCRITSGFSTTAYMPGLCDNYDPPPAKGPSSSSCSCNPRDPKCVCP